MYSLNNWGRSNDTKLLLWIFLMPKFKFEFCSRYCLFLGSAQACRDINVSIEIEQCCYDKTQEGHVKWGYKGKGSSVGEG